jgi:voltage-gated potassium channel
MKKPFYEQKVWNSFLIPIIGLIVVACIGMYGYMTIDHFSLIQAFHMVVITITTAGFRPIGEMSQLGLLFDSIFTILGVIFIVFAIGRAIEFIVSGDLISLRRKRRMDKAINSYKGHYIICGYGRVGHQITKEFEAEKIPYVVIDTKQETAKELEERNIPFIIGDMSQDDYLVQAGIEKAKGLIACADSDTSNVFVTLSARVLNPKIFIIARASNLATETKLLKAGANRVISPYFIAGNRMASMALRPISVDFLDTVTRSENVELMLEEFSVDNNEIVVGKTLEELAMKKKTGATVLAIKHLNGKFSQWLLPK